MFLSIVLPLIRGFVRKVDKSSLDDYPLHREDYLMVNFVADRCYINQNLIQHFAIA